MQDRSDQASIYSGGAGLGGTLAGLTIGAGSVVGAGDTESEGGGGSDNSEEFHLYLIIINKPTNCA